MVQLFLIKFFILSFYHVLLKWLVYGDACGCEGKEAPWAVVKCIRTLPRTNRGKSPNASVELVLGWKIASGALLKKSPTQVSVFAPQ